MLHLISPYFHLISTDVSKNVTFNIRFTGKNKNGNLTPGLY